MPKRKRYEVVDQQWVKERAEADHLKKMLLSAASAKGLVIGIEPDGSGWKVTVEQLVEEDD